MNDLEITVPITTPQPIVIRGDWETNYSFIDDPKSKTVKVQIYPRPAVNARPAVVALPALNAVEAKPADATHLATPGRPARAAVTAQSALEAIVGTQALTFVLWSGDAYDRAQAMNAPLGYGTPDLNAAIASFLATLISS